MDTIQSVSQARWSQKYVFSVLLSMHIPTSQKDVLSRLKPASLVVVMPETFSPVIGSVLCQMPHYRLPVGPAAS